MTRERTGQSSLQLDNLTHPTAQGTSEAKHEKMLTITRKAKNITHYKKASTEGLLEQRDNYLNTICMSSSFAYHKFLLDIHGTLTNSTARRSTKRDLICKSGLNSADMIPLTPNPLISTKGGEERGPSTRPPRWSA